MQGHISWIFNDKVAAINSLINKAFINLPNISSIKRCPQFGRHIVNMTCPFLCHSVFPGHSLGWRLFSSWVLNDILSNGAVVSIKFTTELTYCGLVTTYGVLLTHCGLVRTYGVLNLKHRWPKQWLVTYSEPSRYIRQYLLTVFWILSNTLHWDLDQDT